MGYSYQRLSLHLSQPLRMLALTQVPAGSYLLLAVLTLQAVCWESPDNWGLSPAPRPGRDAYLPPSVLQLYLQLPLTLRRAADAQLLWI